MNLKSLPKRKPPPESSLQIFIRDNLVSCIQWHWKPSILCVDTGMQFKCLETLEQSITAQLLVTESFMEFTEEALKHCSYPSWNSRAGTRRRAHHNSFCQQQKPLHVNLVYQLHICKAPQQELLMYSTLHSRIIRISPNNKAS